MNEPRPLRILSLDGGGIRGLIPATVLAHLEESTGRATSELFDFVAGTSTGGILALALARPGPDGETLAASEIVDFYRRDGPVIFREPLGGLAGKVRNIFEEQYSSDPLEEALERRFGDTMLSEAVVPVLVTSYDLHGREPYFFKSHRVGRRSADGRPPHADVRMRDVARATSAAPTYFEPHLVELDGGPRSLVDGGIYANNPGMCALVEAVREFGATPDRVHMLSLGTGQHTERIEHEDATGWGLARWAKPILDVVFDGVSDTVGYQLRSLLREADGSAGYLRLQPELGKEHAEMDDVRPENLDALQAAAVRMLDDRRGEIQTFVERLAADDAALGT